MSPAALAFEAIAPEFDERFGAWASVAAQRRAVRAALLRRFPRGGSILEVGGGTGEDAVYLAQQGFQICLTDPSPAMVSVARKKLERFRADVAVEAAEEIDSFADRHLASGAPLFDGAFSNFAPLNCVPDLRPAARGLARLLKTGAPAMLVLFGTFCPGEMATEILRGRPRQAFRRFRRGRVPARLAGCEFDVVYHRRAAIEQAFSPMFVLEKRMGIGITVPPSAAEPWMSRHRRLLSWLEGMDAAVARTFAIFGDHILYQFRRTETQ